MDALDEILDTQTHPGVFHPVHLRDPGAWFPGNEAASLLLQSQYIWEDINHLADMYRKTQRVPREADPQVRLHRTAIVYRNVRYAPRQGDEGGGVQQIIERKFRKSSHLDFSGQFHADPFLLQRQ